MKGARLDRSSFALGNGKENTMCLGIESHGFGSRLSSQFVDCAVVVRRILMENIERAIGIRKEDQMSGRLIGCGIEAFTDRHGSDHGSSISIKNCHSFVWFADDEFWSFFVC